jgi:purine-cytosine permease-like protein
VLSAAVFAALMASLSQLTIGLRMEWQAMATCLAIAALAFSLLVAAFLLIQVILSNWFRHFDYEANEAHKARLEKKKNNAGTVTPD